MPRKRKMSYNDNPGELAAALLECLHAGMPGARDAAIPVVDFLALPVITPAFESRNIDRYLAAKAQGLDILEYRRFVQAECSEEDARAKRRENDVAEGRLIDVGMVRRAKDNMAKDLRAILSPAQELRLVDYGVPPDEAARLIADANSAPRLAFDRVFG